MLRTEQIEALDKLEQHCQQLQAHATACNDLIFRAGLPVNLLNLHAVANLRMNICELLWRHERDAHQAALGTRQENVESL